jgi:hypothetical protein
MVGSPIVLSELEKLLAFCGRVLGTRGIETHEGPTTTETRSAMVKTPGKDSRISLVIVPGGRTASDGQNDIIRTDDCCSIGVLHLQI